MINLLCFHLLLDLDMWFPHIQDFADAVERRSGVHLNCLSFVDGTLRGRRHDITLARESGLQAALRRSSALLKTQKPVAVRKTMRKKKE